MPPRSFWKGYLKLSLVTCPVTMAPATTDSERLRFNTINQKTGNRVVSQYVDAKTGKVVGEEDEARGYERSEGDHVLLEEEELDAVALESTRTIDIESFVPAGSIGWVWYDKPHYLVPSDDVGTEAFCVIRDAMTATSTVGISRVVLYRRERAVLLEPRGRGIVVWTLRYGDEVRAAKDYFAKVQDEKPDPALVKLVAKLIDTRSDTWDPKVVVDPVQDRLREIIAAKRKAPKKSAKAAKPATEAPAETGKVISITEALKRSLASETKRSR